MVAALILFALSRAVVGSAGILVPAHVRERLKRVVALCHQIRSSVMINRGDGEHIPLKKGNREAIRSALCRIEQRLKG